MQVLIKNGNLIDPSENINELRNILVEDGIVVNNNLSSEEAGKAESAGAEVIDAEGLTVMPGLIDLHVHFRDPGFTYKETIATGSAAAAKGGFTSVCTMPNTKPAADTAEVIRYQIEEGRKAGLTNVLPIGAITMGQAGTELVDFKALKDAGAVAFSEDGKSVMDVLVYREAMRIAAENGYVIMAHCEDMNLVSGGVMNVGPKQKELGVKGISNAVEEIIEARDIFLAEETGAQLHLCHCSTEASVKLVKMAKELGLKVTGEVCPHHFALCDDDIPGNDAMWKMNPPLRSRKDMEAVAQGLCDGIMDVISTDHAPHSDEEKKAGGFEKAPFGIVGLEQSFALGYTKLVKTGKMSLSDLVAKMSTNPAKVLGIDKGTLKNGSVADITIVNTNESFVVDPSDFASKGTNQPYTGMELTGAVKYTILGGKVVYKA